MRESDLKNQARSMFTEALLQLDAGGAVRQAVKLLNNSQLQIADEIYDLAEKYSSIYAVAIGKAAYPMAIALDEILGEQLTAGIISGVLPKNALIGEHQQLSNWRIFAGGHPLPNDASLDAAQSCFELISGANNEKSIIIFLISGGGSAMIEALYDESISLEDLRETNQVLVGCGASIAEINYVRQYLSKIKGGGLSEIAPQATQISLIISDTNTGDESLVASGPTILREPPDQAEILSIIEHYNLILPKSVAKFLHQKYSRQMSGQNVNNRHYVLLDNQTGINAVAEIALTAGLIVETAPDINQQDTQEGCPKLIDRMQNIYQRLENGQIACLISGGEFSCPVRGQGIGGRNLETVLRMAFLLDENKENFVQIAFLSGGTDGIDGNSSAAGAVCDQTTLERARKLGLDAGSFLENSDSFTFFHSLRDDIITEPTGTNVRDLRIILAAK